MNIKDKIYCDLAVQISDMASRPIDAVSLMANISSLIQEELKFFWTGFYRVCADELILGPFQGPVACTKIKKGAGVCGTALSRKETIVVPDVEKFPGHIACSSQSKSEIVVPVFFRGEVSAVLDIDSEYLSTFDEADKRGLEKIASIIEDKIQPLSAENNFSNLRQLMMADRSYRRFDESKEVSLGTLEELIELTRYCNSGRNIQSLRYLPVTEKEQRQILFETLKWAGYLQNWEGPTEGERPTAYIIQYLDTDLGANPLCDDGIQLEAITLGAVSKGLGCCIIKSFNIPKIKQLFEMPSNLEPRYVVAVGYPVEKVQIIDTDGTKEADIKYYRLPDGTHVVPKRPLSEILLKNNS